MEIFTPYPWESAADLLLTAGLLKATILIGVLAAVLRAVPRRFPGLRAYLWTLGVGVLLALPVLSAGVPLLEVQAIRFPQRLFREGAGGIPAAAWLPVVWILGAVWFAGRFLLHRIRASRLVSRSVEVEGGRLADLLQVARQRMGVRRGVRIAVTSEVASPLLFGWLRPVILLPAQAPDWPEERVLAVLCHEAAHVRRGDYAWLVLGEVARAVYWLNPVVFFGLPAARIEREKACDVAALGAGFPRPTYARHLLEVARGGAAASPAGEVLAFGRRSELRERIGALMKGPREPVGRRVRTAALLGSTAVVCVAAALLAAANFWICPGAA